MSNDALIHRLAMELRPVRRRSEGREALLLLAIVGAEAAIILAVGLVRPDMDRVLGSAIMTWKVGSLALLSAVSCAVAIRSFSPASLLRRGLLVAGALATAAAIAGAFVTSAADVARPLAERVAPMHGMICAAAIIVLALPLLAGLGVVMRGAAPTRPRGSAIAAGLAAGTSGALVFTLCCPMNDPLYIAIWYAIACAAVMGLSRWLLPWRFRL